MRRKKSWGETHFLSSIWIREKIQEKNLFNKLFSSLEENRKTNRLKILK